MPTIRPPRVLLVDDHAVVREGYRRLLEKARRIVVSAEAQSGEQAYRLFCECPVDVVVMDIALPGIGGIEAMRRILARDRNAKVLIFSMHEDIVFASRALEAGARGYITKSSAPEVLVEAVLTVAEGRHYVGHDVAQKLAVANIVAGTNGLGVLTEREFEVFRLIAAGRTLPEISEILFLNYKTIANYQSSIRQKLGAENAVQLLQIAMAHGMVERKG